MPYSPADPEPLLLATRSTDKIREIGEILRSAGYLATITLDDAGLPPTPDESDIEQADTFTGNALAKALHFHRLSGLPTLADDSGLCVDALDGAPGVRSRRFCSDTTLTGPALDTANNESLLAALAAAGPAQRHAHYTCAAVLVRDRLPFITGLGTVSGAILDRPRGRGGFGYDPLFLLPTLGRTFAEIDRTHKHRLSHRGRAVRALINVLQNALPTP